MDNDYKSKEKKSKSIDTNKLFIYMNNKILIFSIFLFIRACIIGVIILEFYNHFISLAPLSIQLESMRASIIIYYFPFSLCTATFLILLKNKKLFAFFLLLDLSVLVYLDKFIKLFL